MLRNIPQSDIYGVCCLIPERGELRLVRRDNNWHYGALIALRLALDLFLGVNKCVYQSSVTCGQRSAHLCSPPPFSCVHFMKGPDGFIGISVMPLRGENEVIREIRVAPWRLDAIKDRANKILR